jgi:hypothetical protein
MLTIASMMASSKHNDLEDKQEVKNELRPSPAPIMDSAQNDDKSTPDSQRSVFLAP